ncbi:unnamed protein product [Parajaminaea phylloscopi]
MAEPLKCRWAVVGFPGSSVVDRFIADVVSSAESPSVPIQHSIAALASQTPNTDSATDAAVRQAWASSVQQSSSGKSTAIAAPAFASSSKDLLSLSSVDSLLLCPADGSSSEQIFHWASDALSKGKAALIPRPASLLLTAQHARELTVLAREKRSWLGIVVKKKTAQAKSAKRPGLGLIASEAKGGVHNMRPTSSTLTPQTASPSPPSSSASASPAPPNSMSLRWAADECARCRERGIFESNLISWDDNIALLECLEEVREIDRQAGPAPTVVLTATSALSLSESTRGQAAPKTLNNGDVLPCTPSQPHKEDETVDLSALGLENIQGVDIGPRRFRKTPAPAPADIEQAPVGETSQEDTSAALTDEGDESSLHGFGDSPSLRRSVLQNGPGVGKDKVNIEILQLKHMLRQKQAQITALLEQREQNQPEISAEEVAPRDDGPSGSASAETAASAAPSRPPRKSAVRISMPPQGYASALPVASSRLPRNRGGSIGSSGASTPVRTQFPTSTPTNQRLSPHGDSGRPEPPRGTCLSNASTSSSATARRARKDAGAPSQSSAEPLKASKLHSPNVHRSSLPVAARRSSYGFGEASSPNTSGENTKGGQDEASSPGGFLAPTRASENRRLATLQEQHQQSSRSGSVSPSGSPLLAGGRALSPDPLVSRLAHELDSTRTALDHARQQLASSQRNMASLQRMYDSAKEGVASTRIDAERKETQLARKDKMLSEALERARRAEAEVKELGRSSREWGSRVRSVESELGEVRRQTARAESAYEALRSACASNKTKWEGEVTALRKQLHDVVKDHKRKAESALAKFEMVEEEWKGREGQRKGLEAVLEGLTQEREKARRLVVEQVTTLSKRVQEGEKVRLGQEDGVRQVQAELDRLLRLMRSGVSNPDLIREQVPST